ncbi:hypothetical protein AMECASPLE_002621 [Ameca splendens]|uniref:Uncharacterized protein n=1 Tax=Ameca splendens TaxID=208324 RepID=A0ABV0ZIJ6_9TELE
MEAVRVYLVFLQFFSITSLMAIIICLLQTRITNPAQFQSSSITMVPVCRIDLFLLPWLAIVFCKLREGSVEEKRAERQKKAQPFVLWFHNLKPSPDPSDDRHSACVQSLICNL